MIIANSYNHLNAREFLIVNKADQFQEIQHAIEMVNANDCLKLSCDVSKIGQVFYSQGALNRAIKQLLNASGWKESRVAYFVTGDETTTREIVRINDKEEQKRIIEGRGFKSFSTFNQVDFQKDRIAVEVQFGKYFSVAYDLHVKHTFFYSRNDIDVGVEIIPTKAMEENMDTGVPWFENEVTNVIREGRTNPPVPILLLGVEPNDIASKNPVDYSDNDLISILRDSDIKKLRSKIASISKMPEDVRARVDKIEHCLSMM